MCLNSKQATEKQRKVTKCEMKAALLFPEPAAPVPASEDVLSSQPSFQACCLLSFYHNINIIPA